MKEFYSILRNRPDSLKNTDKCPQTPWRWQIGDKNFITTLLVLLVLVLGNNSINAQTTLINPATDGGFEIGGTFASNGWTNASSAVNPWVLGTAAASGAITGNMAYVSNTSGTTHAYNVATPCTNYFWKDVTVPAGETKVVLTFNWYGQGESTWDNWQVFYAPTTVTPVGSDTHPGSGAANVPASIAGATFIGSGNLQATVQTATYYLPASVAGTTFRLIFSWKNDGSGGTQPPAAIDNISLVSSVPGTFISIASGNWSSPSTWDIGSVPTPADLAVTVSAGHVVTIDNANQGANNLTVNGTLEYATLPTSFSVVGDLALSPTGVFNVFNGTTGKTLTVAGDITNNGSMNLSVGATSAGNLTLNGNTVQTINGSGTFVLDKIRNLTVSNTSAAIPNINWLIDNISVEYNLNIANAKIDLGTAKFTFGTSLTLTGNTFTSTNGGFMDGGKFSRWWTNGATGYSTLAPTTENTAAGGRYPFFSPDGMRRVFYLGRTTPTVGGQYAVVYNHATTMTTGLSIVDGVYIVTDRWDGNFVVTTEGTSPVAASNTITLIAPNAYYPTNGNSRVLGQSSALSGVHQNGLTLPLAQRSAVTTADLTNATGLFMGINNADIPHVSIANGNWDNPAIWNKGTVPACADPVAIAAGTIVTVNSASNVSKNLTITVNGELIVASGDLTVGCTLNNTSFVNNGALTVTGGTLNVNGDMLHNSGATFNQSGGAINVDGNNNGDVATSVASGVSIVQLRTNLLNWTGGTLTVVDPHANTTGSNAFAYSVSTLHANSISGHTLRFGDGISSQSGGNATNGFRINTWASSGRISFNNLEINGGSGTNRFVSTAYSFGVNGDLTINSNSEFRDNSVYLAGNINNDGLYVATGTFYFGTFLNATAGASSNAQAIGGTGVFQNALTTSTANLVSLTVNNSNVTGVTLNVPLSLSGTLTLTSGKLNTNAANLLTLGTATAAGTLLGGSATAFINGPFARTIATANANTNYILYPVGKTSYAPIWLAPATTEVSNMKAEVFDTNTGTVDASITNLSSRRWEAPLVSGTLTDINLRVGDAGVVSTSIPVQAPSAAGIYANAFGSTATYAAGTPPTTQSNTAVTSANYTGFISYADSNSCSGTPAPGNTIASDNTICLGTSVTLSLQNSTSGSGVTYQWQSSADGIVYTDIVGATDATYTTVPTVVTYYQAVVTCATGPVSGTSTPIQITFPNQITGTTPGAVCGQGVVTLSATGSSGTSISWYDAATAGSLVGTGSPFTTPSITATTSYYAAAETTSPGVAALGLGGEISSTVGRSFFPGSWGGAKTQYIIKASELFAAGLSAGSLTSLGFEPTTSGQTYQGFFVNLGLTTATAASTTTFITAGLSQVYAGTETDNGFTPAANSVNTLAFGTGAGSASTFVWDGTSNIVVSISWSRVPAASTSTGSSMKVDNVGFASAAYRQRDNFTPAAMLAETSVSGTSNFRPRFLFNGQLVCSSPRVEVVATVTSAPTFTLSSNTATICAGETSSAITITAGSSDYDTFNVSPSTGVSGTAVTGYTFNPTASTTYTITASQSAGSMCATTATVVVTVNETPSAIVITPSVVASCVNTITPIMATGGTLSASGIIGTDTTLTTTTEQPTAFCNRWTNYLSQTIYTAAELSAAGINAGNITSLAYDIASLGDAATNANFTVKIGATSSDNFANTTLLSTAGYTTVYGPATYTHTATGWQQITFSTPYVWDGVSNIVIHVSHDGADALYNSETYYSATASNSTLYATNYSGTTTTGTLSSKRLNIRLLPVPTAAITWSPAANLYSDAAATVPYVLGTDLATVYHKSSTTGGPTTYTATSTSSSGCASTATVDVTVSETAAPTGAASQTFCNAATVADLTATGTNIQWYATATGGMALASTTALVDGAHYYASQTVSGCESATRFDVTVTIGATPAPTGDAAQTFVTGQTIADIVVVGTNVIWYPSALDAAAGTNALPTSTPLVNAVTYYATQTVAGCTSATSLAVTVTVNLRVDGFDRAAFTYYPNPVIDYITLSYSHVIDTVEVYNLLGQKVKTMQPNATTAQLDMINLPSATYMIQVTSEGKTTIVKVIKK